MWEVGWERRTEVMVRANILLARVAAVDDMVESFEESELDKVLDRTANLRAVMQYGWRTSATSLTNQHVGKSAAAQAQILQTSSSIRREP